MAKTDYQSVDEYLVDQPEEARAVLERVRGAIRKALPNASEVISYQLPAYRLPEGMVIFLSGWKKHYSLYPATDEVQRTFQDELAEFEVEKGTIRFPYTKPPPAKLIAQIAKFRAAEVVSLAKVKAAAKKAKSPAKKPAPKKSKAS